MDPLMYLIKRESKIELSHLFEKEEEAWKIAKSILEEELKGSNESNDWRAVVRAARRWASEAHRRGWPTPPWA